MWEEIVVIIASLLTLIVGRWWRGSKQLIEGLSDLLAEVDNALADNKLTKAEITSIMDRARDIFDGTP